MYLTYLWKTVQQSAVKQTYSTTFNSIFNSSIKQLNRISTSRISVLRDTGTFDDVTLQ